MQIERIYYPLKTLGWGTRAGIWTVGCSHACEGCCNPELWKKNPLREISLQRLFQMLSSLPKPLDGITISGGEPFDQAEDLLALVLFIKEHLTDELLIYSGYTLKQLQAKESESIQEVLQQISVLVDGRYVEALNDNGALRGSSNQHVHFLNGAHKDKYETLLQQPRQGQHVFYQENLSSSSSSNHALFLGIPPKSYQNELQSQMNQRGIIHGTPTIS